MHISRDCREVTGLAKLRMVAFTGRDAGIISFCLGKVRDHSGRSVANASSLLCGSLPRFQGLRLRNRVFRTSGKLCICPPDGHGLLPVKRRCSRLPSLIGSKQKGTEFKFSINPVVMKQKFLQMGIAGGQSKQQLLMVFMVLGLLVAGLFFWFAIIKFMWACHYAGNTM